MYVFFGAGKIGRRMLDFWKWCGLEPDYFTDNNPDLFGKRIEGIEVVPLQEILKIKDVTYMVTCKNTEPIVAQLQKCGVEDHRIIKASLEIKALEHIMKQREGKLAIPRQVFDFSKSEPKILFDLYGGLVLGGVERWSVQTAEMLESMGYRTCLSVNVSRPKVLTTDLDILFIDAETGLSQCLNQIMKCGGIRYFICNFVGFNFWAACILKRIYGEEIKLIAVLHSDDDVYYDNYTEMQQYIDKCLVISKKIQNKLLDKGFPSDKCEYLQWEVESPEELVRSYADTGQPLRIGYAGRINIIPKRVDLLLTIAEQLDKCAVPYRLQIAGNGEFEKELSERISKLELSEKISCVGYLSHDRIAEFWSKQDIMVTCSETEGHSISQCEAMAQGVVTIVTDTSGARDDIMDGENGFVVPIGAIDKIVDKICLLNENRELLETMGRSAYETIKQNNNKEALRKLWEQLLK